MRIISPFSFETGTSKDSAEGKMSAFTERLLYCGARGSGTKLRPVLLGRIYTGIKDTLEPQVM